ncbi:MAG: hypothetical protein HY680_03755 [Chloroflexi bacterium]|nr:hypothetical protein [Chloroflexota bacterium]
MIRYWSYVDALALALALHEADKPQTFTADSARWHKAILEVKNRYMDALPEVFKRVSFDTKLGQPPYSGEVEHFLHVMAQGGLMSEPNPAFTVFNMSTEQKQALRNRDRGSLAPYENILAQVGQTLSEALHP